MTLPVLLSVPHAGLRIPSEVAGICVLSQEDVREDGDGGAAEIYYPLNSASAEFITTDIARAVVDLNRAPDDFRKDGVIKTHTCWDVPVYRRPPSAPVVRMLLDRYYHPYHERLSTAARKVRLGIDCHTMAAVGPPVGPDAGADRPPVCLSNADGTCPPEWLAALGRLLAERLGAAPSLNHPFRGGYIIRRHGREIPWLQVEFSRAPFLTDREKSRGFLQALKELASMLDG